MPKADPIQWTRPLTGLLDDRSNPDLCQLGSVRQRLNWQSTDQNNLERGRGFEKLFSKDAGYNNEDLHDQMLDSQLVFSGSETPPPTPETPPSWSATPWPDDFPPMDDCGDAGWVDSGYYWGINLDQDPTALLSGSQIACQKTILDIRFAALQAANPTYTYRKVKYFWFGDAASEFHYSMDRKFTSGVCDPDDATGDHLILFTVSQGMGLSWCRTVGAPPEPTDPTGTGAVPTDTTGNCDATLTSRGTGRQPITFLYEAISTTGIRRFLAGTESRIYALNQHTGGWKILADGFGQGISDGTCPRRRWKATQNQDVLLFTNNFDKIQFWLFDSPTVLVPTTTTDGTQECALLALAPVPELDELSPVPELEGLGVMRANVMWTWNSVTFLADVTIGATRYPNKILWSDYQDPLSWNPSKLESIASFQDLDDGEIILGGKPLGDFFVIFTNRKIWLLSLNPGGSPPFLFTKRHPTGEGEGCPAFPNTICLVHPLESQSTASYITYLGKDGIYSFSIYDEGPKRVDWAHVATKHLFSDIGAQWCDNAIAGFNAKDRSLDIFWVSKQSASGFPTEGIRIDTQTRMVSTLDFGCTALCNVQPDTRKTLFDFLVESGICTRDGLLAMTPPIGLVKEGIGLASDPTPADISCIVTTKVMGFDAGTQKWYEAEESGGNYYAVPVTGKTVPVTALDPVTELSLPNSRLYVGNTNSVTPDEDSICKLFEDDTEDCDACQSDLVFVGALKDDYCLKQFSEVAFREICTNPTALGVNTIYGHVNTVGHYSTNGYKSILTSVAQRFVPGREAVLHRVFLDIIAEIDASPLPIVLEIGTASQPVDPLADSKCLIQWKTEGSKLLKCQTAATQNGNTRPTEPFAWPVYRKGAYLYWRLTIDGIGGLCSISALGQKLNAAFDNKLST